MKNINSLRIYRKSKVIFSFLFSSLLTFSAIYSSSYSEISAEIYTINEDLVALEDLASSLKYETNCTKDSTEIMNRYMESIPSEIDLMENDEDIPKACFLEANLWMSGIKGNTDIFIYCDLITKVNPTLYTSRANSLCLNEDYVSITKAIFDSLSSCFELDKRRLFKLFAHESGFLLNITSNTGARCYGQLTSIAIADMGYGEIDPFILAHNLRGITTNDFFPRARFKSLYNEAEANCPFLSGIKKINLSHAGGSSTDNNLSCGLTQNPETCFLYSMLLVKKLLTESERTFLNKIKNEGYFQSVESTPEFDEIIWNLTYLKYNAGSSRIQELLGYFFNDDTSSSNLSNKDSLSVSDFFEEFSSFILRRRDLITNVRKRREIGNLLNKVRNSTSINCS